MAEEDDDDLGYKLARGYAEACRQIDRKADGYIDWAKSQYAKNDVVMYTVWPDHTKLHYIDYELLQDKRRPGHPYGIAVIHCESREKASRLGQMLCAPGPDGLAEN